MAAKKIGRNKNFSIDDAFEEDEDDVIRMYGATDDKSRFKSKGKVENIQLEDVTVRIEDPTEGSKKMGITNGIVNDGHTDLSPTFAKPSIISGVPDVDAVSRDSDSLIPGDTASWYAGMPDPPSWWFLHPKVRENWRVVLSAFLLFFFGIALLATGVLIEILPLENFSGWVFIIAGLICFIPGAYHVVYIILAVRGSKGFDFYNLPLFN